MLTTVSFHMRKLLFCSIISRETIVFSQIGNIAIQDDFKKGFLFKKRFGCIVQSYKLMLHVFWSTVITKGTNLPGSKSLRLTLFSAHNQIVLIVISDITFKNRLIIEDDDARMPVSMGKRAIGLCYCGETAP